jgi:hypothetical protein
VLAVRLQPALSFFEVIRAQLWVRLVVAHPLDNQ